MTVFEKILTHLSLLTNLPLRALALYKPLDSLVGAGSWSMSLLCSPLHWLRIKATFLFPPSSVFIFFYSALVDRESQDFGQQHLYVIFKWPSTHSPKYIENNSAGGFLSLHTLSSIYSLRCFEVANLMNVSPYLIGLLILISLVISDAKHLFMCPSVSFPWRNFGSFFFFFLVCIYFW